MQQVRHAKTPVRRTLRSDCDSATHANNRQFAATGFVDTLAGQCGVPGFADGAPTSARFSEQVWDVFCSPDACQLLVADVGNHRIRAVAKDPRDCVAPAPPPHHAGALASAFELLDKVHGPHSRAEARDTRMHTERMQAYAGPALTQAEPALQYLYDALPSSTQASHGRRWCCRSPSACWRGW